VIALVENAIALPMLGYGVGQKGRIFMNEHRPPEPQSESDLRQYMKHFGETREEQIEKNQAAIQFLRSLREEKPLEGEELEKAKATFELVKQIIDANRSRKLFSQE
jgi:hypothetical protein